MTFIQRNITERLKLLFATMDSLPSSGRHRHLVQTLRTSHTLSNAGFQPRIRNLPPSTFSPSRRSLAAEEGARHMSSVSWTWERRKECKCSQVIQKSHLSSAFQSTKKEFSERRIMGFSREQMFSVVSDVENYHNFLPWCQKSVVKSRDHAYIVADLVIGMQPVTESYTSRVFIRKPSLILADSQKGTHFKQMLTKWQFSPGLRAVPNSCIVDFYVSLEFKSVFHASLANVFFNEVVKAMAGAFYDEARRRFGAESLPSKKIAFKKEGEDA